METTNTTARTNSSLVKRLLRDIAAPEVSVSAALRTAKIIATKLGQEDALAWINSELNGYVVEWASDLPDHRRLSGTLQSFNPYHGWREIQFESSEQLRQASQVPVNSPIGSIEQSLADAGGSFAFDLEPEFKVEICRAMGWRTEIRLSIARSQLFAIVDRVRNLLLDWALELERAGVVGVDMDFTAEERVEARVVTNNIFGPVGVFGDISGHASVATRQVAAPSLDPGEVRDLALQIRAQLGALPTEAHAQAVPVLDKIERLVVDPEASDAELRGEMGALSRIAEAATGNVVAAGIVALVRQALAG